MATYFEQTGGYPTPEIQKKTEEMLNASYQKLLTFQAPDGGFSKWAGDNDTDAVESGLALMVLADMSKVRFIDPAVFQKAATYLEKIQGPGGDWGNGSLPITAAVTWALHAADINGPAVDKARTWLQLHALSGEAYGMVMGANALAALDETDPVVAQIVQKLADTAVIEDDEAHWETAQATLLHAYSGDAATTTTGLAAHLLLVTGLQQSLAQKAVRHLAAAKTSYGGWGSTESTAAALRALALAGAAAQGTLDVACNDESAATLVIDSGNCDLLHIIDLDSCLGPGENAWSFSFNGIGEVQYQFEGWYNTEWEAEPEPEEEFELVVVYDPTDPDVGNPVTVTVAADNTSGTDHGMTLVGIPVPLGMAVKGSGLNNLKEDGVLQEWEVRDRTVMAYLEEFPAGASVQFSFELVPAYPVKTVVPPAFIYSYYNPGVRTVTAPTALMVAQVD